MSEIAPTNEHQSPGSLRNFAVTQGLDPASVQARYKHSEALDRFRRHLAEARGITLDQLHGIGRFAIEQTE